MKIDDELKRAQQLCNILDSVIEYISSIQGKLEAVANGTDGDSKKDDHKEIQYNEGTIKLYDKTNTCIGFGKLKIPT